MFPIGNHKERGQLPIVTITLILLNVIIYLWDRNWSIFGPSVVFSDLAMRPGEITAALSGRGDPQVLGTIFTSLFLHGNLGHLIGNLVFLFVFGEAIEQALGHLRYTIYYLFWGIVAAAAHIFVMHDSLVPTLGASGAIGGILGCYFLLYPADEITIWFYFLTFELPAWILLGLWFIFQVFVRQEGVANWAHAGGFLAGMLTVLLMGGRQALMRRHPELAH